MILIQSQRNMLDLEYAPRFVREYNKLESALRKEVQEKIVLFKNLKNHRQLGVHPLHGRMNGRWSFSVNYRYRIVFQYIGKKKNHAALLMVGDHSIYDQ